MDGKGKGKKITITQYLRTEEFCLLLGGHDNKWEREIVVFSLCVVSEGTPLCGETTWHRLVREQFQPHRVIMNTEYTDIYEMLGVHCAFTQ